MKSLLFLILILGLVTAADAQRRPAAAPVKTVIFAVLNDGKAIEPIGYIGAKGSMTPAIDGASEAPLLTAFHRTYFAKGKMFPLIFGGKVAGNVTVASSDPRGECVNYLANVATKTTRSALKGNIMALATNAKIAKPGSGIRRLPTPAERAEIETLVRETLIKNAISSDIAKYHNLTALDVNNDGQADMVGSFWVEPSATEREVLFFIAELGADKKYRFGYSESRRIKQAETLSEDIKDVDTGVYHERLLDIFDVDGDGDSEIFSYVMSFEGAGFNVYKRQGEIWAKHFEASNYHCGY
ncbi:MAG: hypothetical protein PSX80_00455 [bacterium]|nr:hypothetical protein [bacterium]